eukprot:252704_1
MKRSAPFQDTQLAKKRKIDAQTSFPKIPVDGNNLLSVLLHPLDTETFMKQYWTKHAYSVTVDDSNRVADLLNGPFPFHLKTLLQSTASDKIHVWMKSNHTQESHNHNNDSSKAKPKVLSFTVDDYDSALSCYHCGGSLYFRSSQELADVFIPSLMEDLGVGIGSTYCDSKSLRGEIEVFVSHKPHLTNWHCDFQHNFTIQLFGHKRWYLLPIDGNNSSYFNVYRGNTPHFYNSNDTDLSAKECQFKLHRSESEHFDFEKWKQFDVKEEYKDKIKVVDLKAGSVLYFPSGMWHKVETVSPQSLSINLSIVPMTYQTLIGEAINHFMSTNAMFRSPVLYNDMQQTHRTLNGLCDTLKTFISNMSTHPSCVMPYSFSNHSLSSDNSVCVEMVDFEDKEEDDGDAAKPPEIAMDMCFIINPLSVLIPFADIYGQEQGNKDSTESQDAAERFGSLEDLDMEEEDDDGDEEDEDEEHHKILKQYVLHVNFGNDSFESISRIVFQCKSETTINIINWIRRLRKKKNTSKCETVNFSAKDIKDFVGQDLSKDILFHVLRVFVFFGWLSIRM